MFLNQTAQQTGSIIVIITSRQLRKCGKDGDEKKNKQKKIMFTTEGFFIQTSYQLIYWFSSNASFNTGIG